MSSYQNVPLCSASKKEEIHFPNADHHAKIKSKCKDCSAQGWKRIWCDSTDWWHRWRRLWHSVEFSQIFFTLLPPAHLWLMIFFISKRHQEYIKSDWNFTEFFGKFKLILKNFDFWRNWTSLLENYFTRTCLVL